MDPHRAERLATALREELHKLINFELSDPRVGVLDVAAVELSPDGRKAVVRVLPGGSEPASDEQIQALTGAKGFLRRELAQALDLRQVPDLYFEAAALGGTPDRFRHLLKRARRGRPREENTAK